MNTRHLTSLCVCVVLAAIFLGCAGKKESTDVLSAALKPSPQTEMHPEAYHHFTNAVIYEQEGLISEAIKEYELALSYDPLNFDIRLALGTLYHNVSRPGLAVETLLPITKKTPQVYELIGEAFRAQKQDAEAEEAYRRAWVGDSTNVNVNYQLGVYAVQASRIDEAARYFRIAAQLSGNAELFTQIAEMYSSFNQFDSAAAFVESAIRLDQSDPALYSRQAIYLYSAGRKSESKGVLHHAIARHPNDARLLAQLVETYNAEDNLDSMRTFAEKLVAVTDVSARDEIVFERIGTVLMRANQNDIARDIFEKTLRLDPENRYALFYLGRLQIDNKSYDTARVYFDRLVAADSTIPDGWTNLAFIWQQQKQLDSAERVLELAARKVTTEKDNIQFFLAQVLSQKNMSDSAIAVLRNAIADGGDTVRALFQTGAEYEKVKNFARASEAFELLLTKDPNHHPTLNYYGYMLADRGERLADALAMIEKAIAAEPENGAYLDSYAWILYKLGRYPEALAQVQKAVTKTNNDPIVIEHLGDIQFALGNLQNARDAWKAALAFDPQNKTLKEKLTR